MKTTYRLASLAAGAVLATTAFAVPAAAAPAHHPGSTSTHRGPEHAVFVQTDEVAGNNVAAYRQNDDGSLDLVDTYATGGNGGILPGSVIDHTASQGALTYDRAHQLLYAVNPGSNTVSVFDVDGTRLQLRQVIGSGGTFPVSVTVRGLQVFVGNAQNGGSIQGYLVAGRRLISVPAWHRTLNLDPTLTNFTQTIGQVAFTPRGNQLVVTTKANRNSVEVFNLDFFGTPSRQPVETVIPGTAPFAVAFDDRDNVVVTDGGANASVITLANSRSGALSVISTVPTFQRGTCWIIRDGEYLITTNPGGPSVSTLSLSGTGTPTLLSSTPTDAGTVDGTLSADGRYLYVQTGTAGIVDEFAVGQNASLTQIGSVTVANSAGAEGIAAT